jgi:hypothetical protein
VFLDGPSSCYYSEGDSCMGSNLRHMFYLILSTVIASHVLVGLQLAFVAIHALPSFMVRSCRAEEASRGGIDACCQCRTS